ncbi:MAG: SDR family oxidoreductase [Nitrospinae bacterium]|nr:SDR family oxidoreductase [Nitrospinota bacterium]
MYPRGPRRGAARQGGARALLGRIAEVREIADLALFLCSPEADCLTGHTLTVNGAWLMI